MCLFHFPIILASASFLQNALCSEPISGQETTDTDSVLSRLMNLENKFDAERKEWETEREQWKKASQAMLAEIYTLRQRVESLEKYQEDLQPEYLTELLPHFPVNPDYDLQLRYSRQLLKEVAERANLHGVKTRTSITHEDEVATNHSDAKHKTHHAKKSNNSASGHLPNGSAKQSHDSKPPTKYPDDHHQPIKQSDDQPIKHGDALDQPIKRSEDPGQPVKRSDDINVNSLTPVVTQMGQKLDQLMADFQALKQSQPSTSTFVHWGSSTCPPTSQTVYSGVVGSGVYAYHGSATNYLCLTLSPVVGNVTIAGLYTRLYGSEYQTYQSPHHDMDALCAVCRTPRSTTIMIPGTNVCEAGWQTEYTGFLMAGYILNPSGSEYVCVDPKMDERDGSNQNQDGVDFFYTLTECGSLPCPPYENAKPVTCAVCSM